MPAIRGLRPLLLSTALLMLAALATGCSSTRYAQDYAPGTEFATGVSYDLRQVVSDVPEMDRRRLGELAEATLEERGFYRDPRNPQLLVDMHLLTRTRLDTGSGVGFAIGVPVGRSGSVALGTSRQTPREKLEGVLVVDITERESNTLVWRGSAEGIGMNYFSPRKERRLARVVARVLGQYPP